MRSGVSDLAGHRQPLLKRVLTGAAAGIAAGAAMNVFARAAASTHRKLGAWDGTIDTEGGGRGVQPPQALTTPHRDAAVLAGSLGYRLVTGHIPDGSTPRRLGVAAHYMMSMGCGVIYALVVRPTQSIRIGRGLLYGLAVWAVADEGIVPAAGLSRGPRHLRANVHLFAAVGHGVYGGTLEAVRAVLRTVLEGAMTVRLQRGGEVQPHREHLGATEAQVSDTRAPAGDLFEDEPRQG